MSVLPPYVDFLLAGIATTTACLFTNPIEVVKTRMQLQGELGTAARPYTNPLQAFILITKSEGLQGIQSGLLPACAYQYVAHQVVTTRTTTRAITITHHP
jgi:solute carrier family 25, member 34/35